jgi:catalase (peroxidase I)
MDSQPTPQKKIEILPKKELKVYHSLTCDGSDVIVTKFVEYMDTDFLKQWHSLINIRSMKFDIGHDILHFETCGGKTNLIKIVLQISEKFPTLFMMYDFYTINEQEHEQGTYFIMDGNITDRNKIADRTEV